MYDSEFDPKKHTHKYFCHRCKVEWFASNQFQDLCPNCEEFEDFTFSEISKDSFDIHYGMLKNAAEFRKQADKMERDAKTLEWVQDDDMQTVV